MSLLVPLLEFNPIETLRKLGKLPAKALKDPQMHALIKKRIRTWHERIFPQLDATGLFVPDNADSLIPAK
jgi:hypothetical protein